MSTSGGYHEYIGGCSVHQGMFSTSEFSIEIERILSSCSPFCKVNIKNRVKLLEQIEFKGYKLASTVFLGTLTDFRCILHSVRLQK